LRLKAHCPLPFIYTVSVGSDEQPSQKTQRLSLAAETAFLESFAPIVQGRQNVLIPLT
jgi:hypothetical protein